MNPNEIPVGIVGLGLMGCSIVTCLLIVGHPVIAVAPVSADLLHAERRIREHLENAKEKGLIENGPDFYFKNLIITEDYAELKPCKIVNECTIEDIDIKNSVYKKVETVIAPDALLSSNTSAIPISQLQKLTLHPERFLGLHWTEPAHTTRFLEVICGDDTDIKNAEFLYELSYKWGKEPILVRKDIAGFITNRLMYAMYREAISLVENGYATIEDVDRSCRNNAGYFMTLVGVFRWMDLTGVPAYHTVMKNLLPTLNNSTEVPELIDKVVREGGRGIANSHGFYNYEPGEAEVWEETFKEFTYEIRQLALKYPADVVKKRLAEKRNG
ncbi:3-hydroxyacyl-CoA dehydrogenase family protein [Dyadobacter chenhuakuii]|uniref:3-hydroxyacyl-CoA dehydrogenase family protein n=1 Tax=Dyadobacter chenhuakuii TaxID=2909339 RepID=A0ABY4XSB9_9BACT|nr:3-hydroxyacyl-CoA dehydrogenase family protein [Dyadobacter chenhuakuii]MCF2492476.1 3-hydroxyacyl-CoA dehydrogenase family protein [Dyadobacter chenhuakuii]USJ33224.1 3-hydroxyacyl-CoA dehydrogenase family protein [Dyadobacter chenhuakuii]